jgi:hypothetical protein
MRFEDVIEKLRDGKSYQFGCNHLMGYFYKAPYPPDPIQTERDGAICAITFWHSGKRYSPTLMLYDFDENTWWCKPSKDPKKKVKL